MFNILKIQKCMTTLYIKIKNKHEKHASKYQINSLDVYPRQVIFMLAINVKTPNTFT